MLFETGRRDRQRSPARPPAGADVMVEQHRETVIPFSTMLQRLASYFSTTRELRGEGLTWRSILSIVVRRIRNENELRFADGRRLRTPRQEPLLSLFREIWVERRYRPPEIPVKPTATIVDIGANVGVFTMLAAALVPDGHVFAIEPASAMTRRYRRT